MLSRVARQKNALFHLRRANAHRVLTSSSKPRLHSQSSRLGSIANPPTTSTHERPRRLSFQSNRNLATAAEHVSTGSFGSLDDPTYPLARDYDRSSRWTSQLFRYPDQQFDPSSLVIIDDAPQTRPKIVRKVKGIGGDEDEMMANLDISLKVGHFDRAAALVNRLGQFYPMNSSEYLALHNRYLRDRVDDMIATQQHDMVVPLQKWFEVDMPHGGMEPDSVTYAIMVRMALHMLHPSKRDRTIRRYWTFAEKAGIQDEIGLVGVLNEQEALQLRQICSSEALDIAAQHASTQETTTTEQSFEIFDDVAEVLPVDQKGLGLTSLRESLYTLSGRSTVPMPDNFEGTEEEKLELYNRLRQERLEADSVKSALNRWRSEFENRQKAGLDITGGGKKLGSVMNQWHSDLVSRILQELSLVDEAEKKPAKTRAQTDRCEYGVFLRSLPADRLAAVTILAVMDSFSKGGMEKGIKLSSIASTIGRELQDELIADAYLKKNSQADSWRLKALKQLLSSRKDKEGRLRWKALVHKMQTEDSRVVWGPRVIARTGAVLMSLLFDVGKAPVTSENPLSKKTTTTLQPAFQHAYQVTWGRRSGLIYLHPGIVQIVAREPPADLLARHLPMVCKPNPWTGPKNGGFMIYENNIVRSTPGESLQPAYIKAVLQNDGLKEIRAGLDVLGNTGWAINRDVFDVMLEAWNSGEPVANLAPLNPDIPVPPNPGPNADYETEKAWNNAMRDIENRRSGFHSVRCFQNFQLEVARAFRNSTFYLPHNMDFRGRAYPLPPYLNQMGADNARGLLMFSQAKPLGASGLRWLKIQIANLAGFDKASLSEREQFTMDTLDDILDSANNGLHGRRWWLKAEDPWQCLAACCELRNALQCPDPTEYPSRLPIHQDGSCNGLQHYAALGGDSIGAQQVNLEPSDRPSDVYTGVSEFVKEAVAEDAAQGHPVAQTLNGKVTRKIVKQTVMTNVYGVTFMGAMRQVRKQLIDHYPEMSHQTKKAGALYIARKIFEALGTMFNGAHDIQYWLGDCASRITLSLSPDDVDRLANEALSPTEQAESVKTVDPTKKFRSTVIWTTPLGLPVVQPYRSRKARRVSTTLQDLNIVDVNSEDVVSRRKQLQAFPPNFIHSLDATHMILSANACHEAGLTFSAVHDSFWTHASDVDDMNHILRDAFVRMHSDDVIGRLAAELKVRYRNHMFLAKIDANGIIGRAIRARRKAVKRNTKLYELVEEKRRQALLNSDDPEQQAEGRAMETPASMFEKMGGQDKHLVASNTLGETAVGHVPENLAAAARRSSAADIDTSDPAIQTLFTDLSLMQESPDSSETLSDADADENGSEEPKPKKQVKSHTWLWLPLRFPDVPAKGAWDLTRIRDSQYFFS